MGKFKKGDPKPVSSGIKKGQVREKTQVWNELGDLITGELTERYMQIVKELPDNEFLDRFENILEYFKPKLARTQTDITIDQPIIWQELNYDEIQP